MERGGARAILRTSCSRKVISWVMLLSGRAPSRPGEAVVLFILVTLNASYESIHLNQHLPLAASLQSGSREADGSGARTGCEGSGERWRQERKEGEEGGKIYFEKLGRNIVGAGKYETLRTGQQAEDPGKSWCYCSLAVYRQKSFLLGWISSLSFQGLQLIRWSSFVLCTVICFAQKITGLKVSHI